jgi:hypothetical protein
MAATQRNYRLLFTCPNCEREWSLPLVIVGPDADQCELSFGVYDWDDSPRCPMCGTTLSLKLAPNSRPPV